jgi:PAS domain S-box-containing protein
MTTASISERLGSQLSRLINAATPHEPKNRFEGAARSSAALAVGSGFVVVAWAAIAPIDRRVALFGVALACFALATAYLALPELVPARSASFGLIVSALAATGIALDSLHWTLGLFLFFIATLHTAYFSRFRGVAAQLAFASASFLAVSFNRGQGTQPFVDWASVTVALTCFSLSVLWTRRLIEALVESLEARADEQRVIAQLGQKALLETDVDALMQTAAEAIADTLALERVVVFENVQSGELMPMRACAGTLTEAAELDSSLEPDSFSRYTLLAKEPVLVTDLAAETRFEPTPILLELGVVSAANVAIPGRDHPWGVLGVRTTARRYFSGADTDFLLAVANVIGLFIERRRNEESLQATRADTAELNERLSAVIDASPVSIIEIDLDHRVTVWNETAESTFGWSKDEAIGTVLPFIPDHLVDEFTQMVERVSRGEQIFDFETERRRRDGTLFPYSVSLAARRDSDGKPVGIVGLGTDLSEHRRMEVALAQERQLMRSLLETTTDNIYFKDLESRFLRVSTAQARWLGADSADAVVGKSDADFFGDEHAARAHSDEQEIIRSGKPIIDFEEEDTWKDGHTAWVSTTKIPLRAENGEIIGTFGLSRDINERKHTEEELARSRELYRVVVENSHDMIAVLDPMGRFVFASPSYEQALGYGPEELVNVSPISLVHPSDVQRASDALRQVVTRQDAAVIELRMRHKRGNWIFVEGTTTSVMDENGKLQSILMSVRDISERQVAEEELREAEARYRLLVEQLPLITYINVPGESGRWVYLSPQLEEILGYKPSEWTSDFHNFVEAIHPDDRERVTAERAASGAKGRIGLEYRLMTKNGRAVWMRDEAVIVRDLSGKPLYVQGYLLNINVEHEAESERLRLEAQLLHSQKMEAIGRLAGGIAHDFNNLLTAIIGYSELIVSELDPASSLARDAEEIKRAAEQAAAMTQQLLAFSRRQVLQPALLNPNEVIGHMEKMLQRLIGENIQLVTELESEIATIRCDRSQIEQVIMNLVVNARDAMPRGGRIVIATASTEVDTAEAAELGLPPGSYVVATISDTGFGMDEETISHIFEPFFTTKEQGKGTGLGLATVHGIVEQSNGAVVVASTVGEGSVFRVFLPVTPEGADADRVATPIGEMHGSETLLLVEDEEMVRQLVGRVLRELGYEVFETSSGEEALSVSDSLECPIDLLVTDVVMPGMNGRELAELLTVSRPTTRVLFMSGYTEEAIVHRDVFGGETEFIGKPFTPQELAQKIRDVLEQSENGDARPSRAATE